MSTTKQTSSVKTPAQHPQPEIRTTPDSTTQKIPNRRPMKKTKTQAAPHKAASAFRTISEVAEDLKVEQHVLRFWESKFSQIKPLKRGGGRRYYRPEDIEMLKNIHHLLYAEGYTIKGVQKLLSATRGNLSARVQQGPAALAHEAEAATAEPARQAAPTKKHRSELQNMLDELKSMRKLID